MTAYYNEFDPYAAQWLRNLIHAGHIAPGIVDERSIEDVVPTDLQGFTQCHFFAGVGVWSLALRRAGWPDSRPVWTGSCPCQPFSAAGAGAGFKDPRHLWPSFAWLIGQSKPPVIFGEQVASKAVEPWVDLVHADLEALEYAFGAVPFPSAGVGAPHIRDRLFWVADSDNERLERRGELASERAAEWVARPCGVVGRLDDPNGKRLQPTGNRPGTSNLCGVSEAERMAYTNGGLQSGSVSRGSAAGYQAERPQGTEEDSGHSGDRRPGPINGLWASADWLGCRDGKWRPVEPGTSPLAHGAASRVGRLRAYGNAINAEAATQFISSYLDAISG